LDWLYPFSLFSSSALSQGDMFALAVFIGIYSYGIFFLGILGLLTGSNILGLTVSWLLIFLFYFKDNLKLQIIKPNRISLILLLILIAQLLVNLIGALGPELAFDALWYHLTQPKIWLQESLIRFIPGPIFRYSVTPQLTETLYAAALVFGSEIQAKLIHCTFGVLSLIVTYKISKKLLPSAYCLLPLLVLSGNLVFSWEQTTAYVDLTRTFFESLALLLFLDKKYSQSAVTLGLAVCSKLVSLVSLPIYLFLLLIEKKPKNTVIYYVLLTFLIPLPWLIFAYIRTGNPVYPIFSMDLAMPLSWKISDVWNLFTHSADPVSPIYIITAPLLFFSHFKKWGRGVVTISVYTLSSLILWFIFPHTGGSRFFLPYLPALSVLTFMFIADLNDRLIKKTLIFITLTLTFTSLFYRLAANYRFLPVIFGRQSKSEFLTRNLNYSFGDFYDTDNYLKNDLLPNSKIYPVGINNLYYLNHLLIIPPQTLVDADYLLLRFTDSDFIPDNNWRLIHTNYITKTHLYGKI
jgi:hypothetical protein